jgi:hypothetical protein
MTRKLRGHEPNPLLASQPRRAMLQKAQQRPPRCNTLPQDRRELPGLHRHNVDPTLAPRFVNMT